MNRTLSLLLLLPLIASPLEAAPPIAPKPTPAPRLTDTNAFSPQQLIAMRAVTRELEKRGANPDQYFVYIAKSKTGILDIHLKHQDHTAKGPTVGDICGKCRITHYDPMTGVLSPLLGYK